jgi:glycosyltransferase involved in cell wall biosynthesis
VTAVHLVVPEGIDDPARPSGGNIYDRHLADELAAAGWAVTEHPVAGAWPRPDTAALTSLDRVLDEIPGDAAVLIDGLIASAAPSVLVPHARRVRLIALVHMPLGHRSAATAAEVETVLDPDLVRTRERAALAAARAIVTTSAWSRLRLIEMYALPADRVHVAVPGADPAAPAPGSEDGSRLLCVAAVAPAKGHDLLLDALETLADLPWRCTCTGSLDRDPAFAAAIRARAGEEPLAGRITFTGPRTGPDLDVTFATADLLVLPSRAETYGMVVTEALARGLPVVVTDVGGVTEALGNGIGGTRPGLLVAPDDPAALATALRAWLTDPDLRTRLRRAAGERRDSLPTWASTAAAVAAVLTEVARR